MAADDAAFARARLFSHVAMGAAVLFGGTALALAAGAWPDIPERVPTHFGASGAPDAWAAKSFATVFVMPLMAFLVGTAAAAMAWVMVARDHEPPPDRVELRRSLPPVANFVSGLAILATGLVSGIAVGATRVALGRSDTIGWWPLVAGIGLGLWCVIGALWLVVKHSPLGARQEVAQDASAWKWGMFYVAPNDPCLFVEKRWGGGYTINFGIPAGRRLGWGMLLFFVVFGALGIWAAVSASGS